MKYSVRGYLYTDTNNTFVNLKVSGGGSIEKQLTKSSGIHSEIELLKMQDGKTNDTMKFFRRQKYIVIQQ